MEHENLMRLQRFVDDMNSSNSTLEKSAKLAGYVGDDYIKNVLLYTYDPFRRYYVTSANVKKNPGLFIDHNGAGLLEILDRLNSRDVTGHAGVGLINSFVVEHIVHSKIIYAVLDRNLKIRMDVSEINKVFGDFIPEFDVALAKSFERTMVTPDKKGNKRVDFEQDVWYGSRKLDGCRCICIIDGNGDVAFVSRTGIPFNTLGVLAKEVRGWGLRSVVFDGEVCLMFPDGKEDFSGVMKQIRKKDHTIPNPKYHLFDMLTLDEFRAKCGKTNLGERLEKLRSTISGLRVNASLVSVLSQGRILSTEHLDKLSELASKNGWEGVIIRKDVPYAGKRSYNMLKIKDMQDAEYVVTGVENDEITSTFYRDVISGQDVVYDEGEWKRAGDGQIVPDESVSSYSDTRVMASNIVIVHKGNPVGVGSGLSMAQRKEWYDDPQKIIGQTVTIQYFQETVVDGRPSLRFPVLKWKYDGERDV
jgi:DNA ligase-1